MTNHVHLVVVPGHEKSAALALGQAHSRYTLELNKRHGWIGHLWQNRFYSCPLDHAHLLAALHYVEQNPVRGGLVRSALDWRWSSAHAHCQPNGQDELLSRDWISWMAQTKSAGWDALDWRACLETALVEEKIGLMRRATQLGEPLGSDVFVRELEKVAGRRLRVFAQGRPVSKKALGAAGK